jgi:hypothetical protein
MWSLQQPQQLLGVNYAEVPPGATQRTLPGVLCQSSYCLQMLAVAFTKANSVSSIGTYAAAMKQQLEQSGAWHMYMSWAAAAAPGHNPR